VIELGRENGIIIEESQIRPEEIQTAEELFITSTTKGVMPVTLLDGQKVGNGKPGAITTKLRSLFIEKLDKAIEE
jgi:branched-subunit amino acid aminotransferase/4-amino-4-deoxychorismate lyase